MPPTRAAVVSATCALTTTSVTSCIACSSTTTRSRTRARTGPTRRCRSPAPSGPSSIGWAPGSRSGRAITCSSSAAAGAAWRSTRAYPWCRVTAITLSREHDDRARARGHAAGLAERVTIQLRDYREVTGTFDKLVSIEMLEAIGYAFLPDYFAACARVLRPGGPFALQSITMPDARFESYRKRVDWMQTYIFPGSLIPSQGAIARAATNAGFTITRADDIGPDYVPTLRAWRANFVAALPTVRALGFDDTFVRTWLLYLAFSEAAFAERTLGNHQLLLTSRA
ncbi:MAG: class I SAM-dependent methyltransferase [Kofleriaceae bacterium]